MQLSRVETVEGLLAEYEAFATLVRALSDAEWRSPSRCEGWEVRDVAGHVIGLATDVVAGAPGSRTPEQQAEAAQGRSPSELADELERALGVARIILGGITDDQWDGPSGAPDLSMRQGVHTLWYDTYVHADDIRAATGRPADRGPGLRSAVIHLAELLEQRGWGPATIAVDGVEEIAIGAAEGTRVTGDPHQLVLVVTGRAPAETMGLDEKVNIYA